MLGGQVLPPALLLGQVFLEMGCCEGEGLPTEAHQVGVLEPGVTEAVFDGRTGPEQEETSSTQRLSDRSGPHVNKNKTKHKFVSPGVATEDLFKKHRGTLGHILVEFREVKLCRLDPGFSLLRIYIGKRQPAA